MNSQELLILRAGFIKPSAGKSHLKFKDFLECIPPLKILTLTKTASLKEVLKNPINFKQAKDLNF